MIALRSEPKTLNPLTAADGTSREVISTMQADLVHINRATQLTEPALAKSWKISADGLRYTLTLRQGLKFSDGHPVDIEDVLFTFRVYLDESVHATQRDLLIVGGKPIAVRRVDAQTVEFVLAKPYGVGERLFDGLAILPRHLLEAAYKEGKLAQSGTLGTTANQWAGLGAFRLKEYVAGQRLVLERNPYYWKADEQGNRLPYLDEIVFLFVPSADAQVLRFQSGETDRRGRITKRGPGLLRKMLVECAWIALRYNTWARQLMARISRGQRTRKPYVQPMRSDVVDQPRIEHDHRHVRPAVFGRRQNADQRTVRAESDRRGKNP